MESKQLPKDWKQSFICNFKQMIDDLDAVELIPHCVSADLLTVNEKAEVESQGTSFKKNDKLLVILYKKMLVNPASFITFIHTLNKCPTFSHLERSLINYYDLQPFKVTAHDLAIHKMQPIYMRTYKYILPKVRELNFDTLLPALVSLEVLGIEEKEEISSCSEFKAERLLSLVYARGFEAYSRFAIALQHSNCKSEMYIGQLLFDNGLWSMIHTDLHPGHFCCKLHIVVVTGIAM